MNLHKNNVLDPRNERQRKIDEMIEKNVNEERIRQQKIETQKLQKKNDVYNKYLFNKKTKKCRN